MAAIYERWVLRHPDGVLIAILVLALILALGLPRLHIDASADALIGADGELDYFRTIDQRYASGDFLAVTFTHRPTPDAPDLFADAALATLQALHTELAAMAGVARVNSLVSVPLLFSPRITITDIEKPPRTLLTPDTDRELARREFLDSPVFERTLLSPDALTTAIQVSYNPDSAYDDLLHQRDAIQRMSATGNLSDTDTAALLQVEADLQARDEARAKLDQDRVRAIRQLLIKYADRAELHVAGPGAIRADITDLVRHDAVLFAIGLVLVAIALMAAIFRNPRQLLVLPLLTCVLAVTMVAGGLGWMGGRLTPVSAGFAPLLLLFVLALSTQLLTRYRDLRRSRPGADDLALVTAMVASTTRPYAAGTLAAVAAFGTLAVSGVPALADLGGLLAAGLALSLGLGLTLIPAALLRFGRGGLDARRDWAAPLPALCTRIAAHGRTVLIATLSLALVCGYGISRLRADANFIDFFRADTSIHRALAVIDAQLGGTAPFDIVLQTPVAPSIDLVDNEPAAAGAGLPDAGFPAINSADDDVPFAESAGDLNVHNSYWFTPPGLEQLEQLQDFLQAQPEVGKVSSLVGIFRMGNALAGHRLTNYELTVLRQNLRPSDISLLIAPYLNDALGETRVNVRTLETSNALARPALRARLEDFLQVELRLPPEQYRLTGPLLVYDHLVDRLLSAPALTLGLPLLAIVLVCGLWFRSPLLAAMAAIPSLLAIGVVLGGMGLFGVRAGIETALVMVIAIAFGIDQGVRGLQQFRAEFARDLSLNGAVARNRAVTGTAVYYAAAAVGALLAVLATSQLMPLARLGALSLAAIPAALWAGQILLPALLQMMLPPPGDG